MIIHVSIWLIIALCAFVLLIGCAIGYATSESEHKMGKMMDEEFNRRGANAYLAYQYLNNIQNNGSNGSGNNFPS
jgi:hypothetical protein